MRPKTLKAPQTLQMTLGFLIACGSPWAPSCSKDAISHQGWLLCSFSTTSQLSSSSLHFIVPYVHLHPAMVHIGYFELWFCCCSLNLTPPYTALPSHFFLTPLYIPLFSCCMPAVMRCIHKITYIHHAEGCKMHSHYISIIVTAWIPHDSWRATVFLLHVPFYGHQLGAYNVFHVEVHHRLFWWSIVTTLCIFPVQWPSTHPLHPFIYPSLYSSLLWCPWPLLQGFLLSSSFLLGLWKTAEKLVEDQFWISLTLNGVINDVPPEECGFLMMGEIWFFQALFLY